MQRLTECIRQWMDDPGNNAIEPGSPHRAFDMPLLGVAAGDDPLFYFLKRDIGPGFYWTPHEAWSLAFPSERAQPEDLSVVAWVLPQTKRTRAAHRRATATPSIEWSQVRHYGEQVNLGLRAFVVAELTARGSLAAAPVTLPQWSRELSPKYGFASSWSERHAAHACGLGTFGLSDGLITPAGKAVRVGSVVVRHVFEPTPRSYSRHNEWCLFAATGKCLACARRCPAGAISERGHDKEKCKRYIREITAPFVEREQLGVKVNACGLCQVKVPCEHQNPLTAKKGKAHTGDGEKPEDGS